MLTLIMKTNQQKENKMEKTHISETSPMYKVSDLYNHKYFKHWKKGKRYTGESMSNIRPSKDSYVIYDLIDKEGYIYYEIHKLNNELDHNKAKLLLTTYDKKQVNKYMSL